MRLLCRETIIFVLKPIALLVFFAVVFASNADAAWIGPTTAPPNGNIEAPLNTGTLFGGQTSDLVTSNVVGTYNNLKINLEPCLDGQVLAWDINGSTKKVVCSDQTMQVSLLEVLNHDANASAYTGGITMGSTASNWLDLGGAFKASWIHATSTTGYNTFASAVSIGTVTPDSLLQVGNATQHFKVDSSGNASTTGYFQAGINGIKLLSTGSIGMGNSISDNSTKGLDWHLPTPGQYGIFRTIGAWSSPNYQQLNITFPTGIILNPGSAYGRSYVSVVGNQTISGYLGIGTAKPNANAKLEIIGNTSSTNFCLKGNCISAWPSGGTGDSLWGQNADNIYNLNIGNVGIGTATPAEKLEIYADSAGDATAKITNPNAGVAAYSNIYIANANSANDSLRLITLGTNWNTNGAYVQDGAVVGSEQNLAGGLSLMARGALADMRFYTGGYTGQRMTILSGGNIGIGLSNPDVKLDVGSGAGAGNIISINGADDNFSGYRLQTADVEKWFMGMDNTVANNDLIFRGNSSNYLVIKNDTGRVGIGTTVPVTALEVVTNDMTKNANSNVLTLTHTVDTDPLSGIATGLSFNVEPNGGPVLQYGYISSIATGVGGGNAYGDMAFFTRQEAGAGVLEVMRITSKGNLGIGTTKPNFNAKLEIIGNTSSTSFCLKGDCISSWPTGGSGIEVDGVIGNEVTGATNATLLRDGAGTAASSYTLALNLNNANTWTANQSFSAAAFGGYSIDPAGIKLTTPSLFADQMAVGLGVTGGLINRSGAVNAKEFCINGNCISTWPSGGTGTAVSFVGLSTTAVNGAQSGYRNVNNLCSANPPIGAGYGAGAHVCTVPEILSIINASTSIDPIWEALPDIWVSAGTAQQGVSTNDCQGWTVGNATNYGNAWNFSMNGGYNTLKSCDTALKFACCK